MKLNLKNKDEGKINVGVAIYKSDKEALDVIANNLGISTSLILRSIINDLIDNNLVIEL